MIFYGLIGLVGAALGSFASVLMARADNPRRVIWDTQGGPARSACPSCGRTLATLDLLPLFGWLLVRGRCRGCGAKIGLWYLLLELIAAAVMMVAFFLLSFSLAFFVFLLALPVLLALGGLLLLRRSVPRIYWGLAGGLLVAFLFVL